ncbi:MAG: archaeosortase/exosortase family protein [Euryarchaeota archaeon]|nr:archaeosortase/exosortase family protein [Euryarchaeota archaeon]
MDLPRAVGWAKGHRNVLVVAAIIFVFAGADLLINRPKGEGIQWFSAPLLGAGFGLLALIFWPTAKPGPMPRGDTLAHRLIRWATWRGRLVPLLPLLGLAIVVGDLAFNALLSAVPALLTHDLVALLFGAALLVYPFVPARYGRERDFVLLFVGVLALILVLPLLLVRLLLGDLRTSVDLYSAYALAPQTSALLSLLGVRNSIVFLPPETAPGIAFTTAGGLDVIVFITSACSGIYSFAIFASAFAAYVLTEQRTLTRRVFAFFALGILLAYAANILRMAVIVLIGYGFDTPQTGVQGMLVAHSNAGWIIFLAWVGLFWLLLFRFLPREEGTPQIGEATQTPQRGVFCGICGVVLTVAIPATRCPCGKFYHVECLAAEESCPNCHAPPSPHPATDRSAS